MSYTNFRPRIRSRHPSHNSLRKNKLLPLLPFKSVIRFGSTTDMKDTITNGGNRIEINTIDSVKNSSNKLLMKTCFTEFNIKTADWWKAEDINDINDLPYPVVTKHLFGSRGTGNKKHDNAESLLKWLENHEDLSKYIIEKFYNYTREYRLHVTKNGCFYTCRKMLKRDTPEEKKWYRNDDNCVWILEENENFDKPVNWVRIEEESVKALKSVGLDVGAVDLRIQSATNKKGEKRENPDFIIVEINSAPSFGDITLNKYIEELPKILLNKYNEKEE